MSRIICSPCTAAVLMLLLLLLWLFLLGFDVAAAADVVYFWMNTPLLRDDQYNREWIVCELNVRNNNKYKVEKHIVHNNENNTMATL